MSENLTLRRSSSNPMLIGSGSKIQDPKAINKLDFIACFLQPRTFILISLFFVTVLLSYLSNIYAYSQYQSNRALPDIISDQFKSFARIKNTLHFLSGQWISLFTTIILVATILYLSIRCFNLANYRKFTILLSTALFFHAICNISTQLSVPCYGTYGCTCETRHYEDLRKDHSIFTILVVYFATFGLGTKSIPSCGAYMSSGFVTFQWTLVLFVCDIIARYKPERAKNVKIGSRFLVGLEIYLLILLRNVYTVAITIPIIFVELTWYLYSDCQELYMKGYVPFTASRLGKLFGYFEEETILENHPIEASSSM